MATESIILAKPYSKPSQLKFPVGLSEKLDGVPGDFYWKGGKVFVQTRQNEPIHSVEHIRSFLESFDLPDGFHLVGELYKEGLDFKKISGMVRNTKKQFPELLLNVWDFWTEEEPTDEYLLRLQRYHMNVKQYLGEESPVVTIPIRAARTQEEFDKIVAEMKAAKPDAEGIVARIMLGKESYYKPGWRSPGVLKIKTVETADLEIAGFEEAVDKHGVKKGMVGRIHVHYNGAVIGAGPGKMKHSERIAVWKARKQYIGKTVEIAYMPDESYDALREARFWRFRPDKD